MKILITARGPKLAPIITQLAADFGHNHEVRVIAYYTETHKYIRSKGVKTVSPLAYASMSAATINNEWNKIKKHNINDMIYDGFNLLELSDYERRRAQIENKTPNDLWFCYSALKTIISSQSIIAYFKPHLIAVWNGGIMESKIFVEYAKKYNIGIVYLERGLLPDSLVIDPCGVNAESIICKGDWNIIRETSVNIDKIISMRQYLNTIMGSGRSIVEQPNIVDRDTLVSKYDIPINAQMLFLPGQIDTDTNIIRNASNWPTNEYVIEKILNAIEMYEDIYLLYKPHPENRNTSKSNITHPKLRVINDVHLHSLIQVSDACIVRNSTAGLEAIILRKPVIALGNAIYTNKGFTYDLSLYYDLSDVIQHALRDKMTDEMINISEIFLEYIIYKYSYYMKSSEPLNGVNSDRVSALLKIARNDEKYDNITPIVSDLLEKTDEWINKSIESVSEINTRLSNPKEDTFYKILLIQASDEWRYSKTVERISRYSTIHRLDILADSSIVQGLSGRKYNGLGGMILSSIYNALGNYDIVLIVVSQLEVLSRKARIIKRIFPKSLFYPADL